MWLYIMCVFVSLTAESRTFEANDSDGDLTRTIDAHCPVAKSLPLKLGAQVKSTTELDCDR